MGTIKKPLPVKLIAGLIYHDESFLELSKKFLVKKFGQIDFESETLNFNYTDYYSKEMGNNLLRKFISFKKLLIPEDFDRIKLYTNKIESRLSCNDKRQINIDPGYLNDAKLVLLTTKDYSHRIYLGRGIYAETTLVYKKGNFEGYDWTYPDYKKDYINIFTDIRKIFLSQIH